MELIAVPGAELATLTLGRRGAPPLVMLHGLLSGNMASWYSPFASPLSATHHVLLYDQRGHGGSSLPSSGFDLDRQADDLRLVLEHHGYGGQPVDVVGHSMGALIALRFALRAPQAVRRLVLVDAPMPAREHVSPGFEGLRTAEAFDWWFGIEHGGLGGRRRERLHKRLSALFLESTLLDDVAAMDAEPAAALAALRVPTLLVYGLRSACLPAGQMLAKTLPDAGLELVDCGHYVLEEAPQALRAALIRFLSDGAVAEAA